MKKFRKIMAVLVAAIMIVAMAVPAWAAETNTATQNTYNASVTITGVNNGNTVNFYRIVEFKLDSTTNGFSYTLATGLPAAYDSIAELDALSDDGYTFTEGSTAKACADTLANAIATGTVSPIATVQVAATDNHTVSKNDLPAGWYVVTVSGTADTSKIYQNMIVDALPIVDSTNNSYKKADAISFTVKHSDVSISKGVGASPNHTAEVDTTDKYSVGDEVPFEIKTNIPNYPNPSKEASFVISDLPSDLTDNEDSVKVTVEDDGETGTTLGTISGKFTVAQNGDGFTVTFIKDYILAHPGKKVTVNYNATIKSTAVIANNGETASNTAKITFNPNPNEITTVQPEDTTKLFTYGVSVQKKISGTDTALPGASFKLVAANETGTGVADPEVTVKDAAQVNENGLLTFDGLEAGTYYLIETKAPAGYVLDTTPRQVVLSSTTATGDDPIKADTQTYVLSTPVENTPAAELPSTGGMGTTVLYIVGGMLVILAGAYLFFSRKRTA